MHNADTWRDLKQSVSENFDILHNAICESTDVELVKADFEKLCSSFRSKSKNESLFNIKDSFSLKNQFQSMYNQVMYREPYSETTTESSVSIKKECDSSEPVPLLDKASNVDSATPYIVKPEVIDTDFDSLFTELPKEKTVDYLPKTQGSLRLQSLGVASPGLVFKKLHDFHQNQKKRKEDGFEYDMIIKKEIEEDQTKMSEMASSDKLTKKQELDAVSDSSMAHQPPSKSLLRLSNYQAYEFSDEDDYEKENSDDHVDNNDEENVKTDNNTIDSSDDLDSDEISESKKRSLKHSNRRNDEKIEKTSYFERIDEISNIDLPDGDQQQQSSMMKVIYLQQPYKRADVYKRKLDMELLWQLRHIEKKTAKQLQDDLFNAQIKRPRGRPRSNRVVLHRQRKRSGYVQSQGALFLLRNQRRMRLIRKSLILTTDVENDRKRNNEVNEHDSNTTYKTGEEKTDDAALEHKKKEESIRLPQDDPLATVLFGQVEDMDPQRQHGHLSLPAFQAHKKRAIIQEN